MTLIQLLMRKLMQAQTHNMHLTTQAFVRRPLASAPRIYEAMCPSITRKWKFWRD